MKEKDKTNSENGIKESKIRAFRPLTKTEKMIETIISVILLIGMIVLMIV